MIYNHIFYPLPKYMFIQTKRKSTHFCVGSKHNVFIYLYITIIID